MHQLSRVSEPGEVTECGHRGHCDRAWHPAESLERVDDRGEPPALHLVGECLCQTRQPFGVVGDRADVFLAHDLLCRGGTDDLAAPPEVRWTPGRPARITDSVPQEKGFELASQPSERGWYLHARRHRSRIASSSTWGTETGVGSPSASGGPVC